MSATLLALLLALSAPPPAPAPTKAPSPAQCRIAVLDAEQTALTPDEAAQIGAITESIAIRVGARSKGKCAVITPADVRRLMEFEAGRQECNVEGASCIAEIGTALGVQQLIAPAVSRVGGELVVRVTVLDTSTSSALARAERVVTSLIELRAAALSAADDVIVAALPAARPTGEIALLGVGVAVAGGALALAGTVAALLGESALVDASSSTQAKDAAYVYGVGGVIVAGVGVAGAVAGGVLAFTLE